MDWYARPKKERNLISVLVAVAAGYSIIFVAAFLIGACLDSCADSNPPIRMDYAGGTSFDLGSVERGEVSLYIHTSVDSPVCFCAVKSDIERKGSDYWLDMYDVDIAQPRGCVIISRDESRDGEGNWSSLGQVSVCGELSRGVQ